MKKKYIKPSISEYEVSPMSMICQSSPFYDISDDVNDDDLTEIPVDKDHTFKPWDSL